MVDYQDSAILRRLVLEKLDAGRTAIRNATVNKGPALSTMASSGGVKADAGEEYPHRPTTRREVRVDLNSGKGPGVNAPAKFTVLTCKAPNAHGRRKKAQGTYLRLVWSR